MQKMKPFRDPRAGVPDLLNWAYPIASGVVLCKSGGLVAGYYYRGADSAAATAAERNLVTERINDALRKFGGGWSSWTDCIRVASPGYPAADRSHFPDPVSRLIDAERREQFERHGTHYESNYVFMVHFMPPSEKRDKVSDWFYDDDADTKPKGSAADRALASMEQSLRHMEDAIGDALLIRRMGAYTSLDSNGGKLHHDELVDYLDFCLTGEVRHLVLPADEPAFLDTLIGGEDLYTGSTPLIGNKFVTCLSIEGYPQKHWPGILEAIDQLPMPFRWSARMIYLEPDQARRVLGGFMRHWAQRVQGLWAQLSKKQDKAPNEDAQQMVAEAKAGINDSNSGLVAHGYYSNVLVLMDEDRSKLDENARTARRLITALGFPCRIETINTMETWLGTMAGHVKENVRSIPTSTIEQADMMPTSSVWAGLENNPCPFYPPDSPPLMHAITDGCTPIRINTHIDDTGHFIAIGPTGGGKSALMNMIKVQAHRYPDAQIWMFEVGHGSEVTTEATYGQHHDIGGDTSRMSFAPLQELETPADIASAAQWIEICYELQTKESLTTDQRNEVWAALVSLADAPRRSRSITDFAATCQDLPVRKAMSYYSLSGAAGALLDAQDDGLQHGRNHCFEVQALMQMPVETSLPTLLHLFRRFERSLDGSPAFLLLDEVWLFLAHPVFLSRIETWLRVLRKLNVVVGMATQAVTELAKSGLLPILLESCQTQFLLANKHALQRGAEGIPGPREMYEMLGLNEAELHIIRSLRRKREYYLRSPLGRRKFDMNLGPIARSFVTVNDKAERERMRKFKQLHGRAWPFAWLDSRNVEYRHLLGDERTT